jgi:hypothetical protein
MLVTSLRLAAFCSAATLSPKEKNRLIDTIKHRYKNIFFIVIILIFINLKIIYFLNDFLYCSQYGSCCRPLLPAGFHEHNNTAIRQHEAAALLRLAQQCFLQGDFCKTVACTGCKNLAEKNQQAGGARGV